MADKKTEESKTTEKDTKKPEEKEQELVSAHGRKVCVCGVTDKSFSYRAKAKMHI